MTRTGQLDFFDPPPPRPPANWTPTSRAAAASVRAHAPTMRERVYAFIAARGGRGATNEEIAAGLGMRLATVCGRTNELWGEQRIRDSGETRRGVGPAREGMGVRMMRFDIIERGRPVMYALPWWRVAWAFARRSHPAARVIRRVFWVWLRGNPVVETPDDREDPCAGSR